MNILTETRRPLVQKLALSAVLAIGGALAGYGVGHVLGARFGADYPAPDWADALAIIMAVAMVFMAGMTGLMALRRKDLLPKGTAGLQVVVLLLAAVLFVLPMVGGGAVPSGVLFGVVGVVLALQSLANLVLWRRADEMLRRVMSETSAMAFWASQVSLFLYAAGERLGLIAAISPWGLIGVMMGVYMIASIIAGARRGLT